MRGTHTIMGTRGSNEEAREFPRHSALIPVQVEVSHAWQGTVGGAQPGSLLNVSRGGAGIRLYCVLPPRTGVVISVATGGQSRRLPAEVVWTSVVPGRGSSPGVYGIRWVERLSPKFLESLPLGMDYAPQERVKDAPRA